MKIIRGSLILLAAVLVIVFAVRLFPHKSIRGNAAEQPLSVQTAQNTTAPDETLPETNLPPELPPLPPNGDTMRFSNLTEDEKKDLVKKFRENFKPAVEKWCKAYEGRVPFHSEDLTFDKFVERERQANGYLYSFVVNGITLVISDKNTTAEVFYMMTRTAAKKLSDLPQGAAPSAQISINHDDIIRMVKADSGVEFERKDINLHPTGLGTAMNGGAFVDVGPYGAGNGRCKVSPVFVEDGTLVYYLRDPFF